MRMNMIFTSLFVLVLAIIVGCAKSVDPSAKYFQFNVGMKWEYQVKANKMVSLLFSKKGDIKKYNVNAREWKQLVNIEPEETIEGKKYYKYVTTYSNLAGVDPEISYLRTSKEGIYLMKEGSKEHLEIPFPLIDGKTWQYHDPDSDSDIKCKAEKKDKIYAYGNTYSDGLVITREYKLSNSNYNKIDYYAPNVGLVKSVMTNITKEITIEGNLIPSSK